jgi:AICAR transformylase/IMP cyclohydrolase PurH
MIRAAAKNHAGVAVVVDPADYAHVLNEIDRRKRSTRCAS